VDAGDLVEATIYHGVGVRYDIDGGVRSWREFYGRHAGFDGIMRGYLSHIQPSILEQRL
jgi:hypothetical protein